MLEIYCMPGPSTKIPSDTMTQFPEVGSYRLIKNDTSIVFLELLTLVEQDNSLSIRLKHFNSDLTGWGEKDVVREFKLVKKEENKLWFQGMTFQRIDERNYKVFLAIQKKNGNQRLFCRHPGRL